MNATVDKVRIIRAKTWHYILPDIWTPVESPILPAIILGIFGVIKVALIVAGFIVGCWVAYEIRGSRDSVIPFPNASPTSKETK